MSGLGTDIVEIERVAKAIAKPRFLDKVYTPSERAWLDQLGDNKAQSAAGLFCAKEAIAKALGTGFGAQLGFHDIEIGHTTLGAPIVLRPKGEFLLSISHCRDYAVATALCIDFHEKEE